MVEFKEATVEQVGGHHAAEGLEHRLNPAGVLSPPIHQHAFDLLTLEILLRATEVAGDDWESTIGSPCLEVTLFDIGQRPNHRVEAVVREQPGGHGLEGAAKKKVEEEGLQDVVTMMTEGDLCCTELVGHAIEDTAPQPRAERAHGLALWNHALDNAVCVLFFDVKWQAQRGEIGGQRVRWKSRMALVQVDSNELKLNRGPRPQRDEDVE